MPIRFATLASGSKGNCAIVEYGAHSLLIDIGIGPSALMQRFRRVGSNLSHVAEVILTHTHGDHVHNKSLEMLAEFGIPLRCHPTHAAALATKSGFDELSRLSLVRSYDENPFMTSAGLNVHPLRVRHGAGRTYGFRITCDDHDAGQRAEIGYVADLGCWNDRTAAHFRNCGILAVEFNHDVRMTHESRRHYMVKMRNLSNDGHLSNAQGRDLVRAIISKSDRVRPGHLVLLHISEDCNSPDLAEQFACEALSNAGPDSAKVIAASQREPIDWLEPIGTRTQMQCDDIGTSPPPARLPETLTQQEFGFQT